MSFAYANPTSGPSAGGIGWFNFGNLILSPGQTVTGLSGTLNDEPPLPSISPGKIPLVQPAPLPLCLHPHGAEHSLEPVTIPAFWVTWRCRLIKCLHQAQTV